MLLCFYPSPFFMLQSSGMTLIARSTWNVVREKLLEPMKGLLTWSSQALPTNRNMTVVKKNESASTTYTNLTLG